MTATALFEYRGWTLHEDEDIEDDNRKMERWAWRMVRGREQRIDLDWSPYRPVPFEAFQRWVRLGFPTGEHFHAPKLTPEILRQAEEDRALRSPAFDPDNGLSKVELVTALLAGHVLNSPFATDGEAPSASMAVFMARSMAASILGEGLNLTGDDDGEDVDAWLNLLMGLAGSRHVGRGDA